MVRECLRAAGMNGNFPRKVVFGPSELGGLEWDNFHSLKCTEQIKVVLGHLRQDTNLGKLIRINIETVQLLSGSSVPIFQMKEHLNYIEDGWIVSLHHSLVESGVQLKLLDGWLPKKQRKHDLFVMEAAIKMGFSEKELKGINLCRLYLRVITLADLCDVEGLSRNKMVWDCKERMKSKLKWPAQKRPGTNMRKLWRRFLSQLIGDKDEIKIHLGKWKGGSVHLLWPVVLDQKNNVVYTRKGKSIFSHDVRSEKKYEGKGEKYQGIILMQFQSRRSAARRASS